MTFEEFFIKKKIDLDRLKLAEPGLYEEFRYDYAQMGEKSFDHTKKFWFNKLRKIYHLKPDQKPELKKPKINALGSQAVPLSSPAIEEKPVYSPLFKPRMAKPTTEPAVNDEAKPEAVSSGSDSQPESQKPAYKPRFKAAAVKNAPEAEKTENIKEEGNNDAEVKPAYKPRFKPAMIKKELDQTPGDVSEEKETTPNPTDETEAKPAYKPRFKPGMMNRPKPKDEE